MSEKEISRESLEDWIIILWRDGVSKLSVVCKRLTLSEMALTQVKKRFCVKDGEDRAQYRTLWNTIGQSRDLQYVVIKDTCLYYIICEMSGK